MTTQKETLPAPAHRLARNWKNQTVLLWIVLVETVALVASPLYWHWDASQDKNLLIFDTVSGALVSAPLIDPTRSKDFTQIASSLAAHCILDRNEMGMSFEYLFPCLFLKDASKVAHDEFNDVSKAYREKHLQTVAEVLSTDSNFIGPGQVRSTVRCHVHLNGTEKAGPFEDNQEVTLVMEFQRNPTTSEGRNYYPLVLKKYHYAPSDTQNKTASK